ncbi:MAG: hypothetical protein HY288_18490 [Planctomycetia bacterium]|nr:hypothetical protein [Planctomycetia bacterium]
MEEWIEAFARYRRLLPAQIEEIARPASNGKRFVGNGSPDVSFLQVVDKGPAEDPNPQLYHPLPGNKFIGYRIPDDSQLTEADAVFAMQIAATTRQLQRAAAAVRSKVDDPGYLRILNRAFNPFAPSGLDDMGIVADLELKNAELELLFTQLGYERIAWRTLPLPFLEGSGLETAQEVEQIAGPEAGLKSVTIDELMNIQAIVGLAATAGKLLAIGGARVLETRAIGFLPKAGPSVAKEAESLLQKITDEELEKLSANVSLAERVLRPSEIIASIDPRIARMQFGRALEKLVGNRVETDPILGTLFDYTGRTAGPDFVGIGRFEGLIFDITTPGQAALHRARSYGDKLIIIEYTRPLSFH